MNGGMQDLRDKLLRAGLVDKRKARKAKTEARRKKKRAGGEKVARAEQEHRREQFGEKKRAEAERVRALQAEINEQRARQQRAEQLRHIIERNRLVKTGGDDQSFYFAGPDRHIRRLRTTFAVAQRLRDGQLAAVWAPYDAQRDFRLVDSATARRIEKLDAGYLLFWNEPGGDRQAGDDLPTYGATGPSNSSIHAARETPPEV